VERQSQFIKSATRKDQYPEIDLPHVAFAGRSNVGKSSLINCLVGRKNLARISSTPGRTQLINFFEVEGRLVFVDLPGYGYARAPERIRAAWGPMIAEFLTSRKQLRLVVVIVDGRHRPTEQDQMMVDWLFELEIPFSVVAGKIDRIPKNRRCSAKLLAEETLKVDRVLPFSTKTGEGVKELWSVLNQATA
jgi:GTP-binding protein